MDGLKIVVSVVSHLQGALLRPLLEDLERIGGPQLAVVVTHNVPEPDEGLLKGLRLNVTEIRNAVAQGFGANHNAAFARCRSPYFCVCNPDIRLQSDPFAPLLQALADPGTAVAGPLVRNPQGEIEDSARRFPTAWSLLKKAFVDRRAPDYPTDRGPLAVDWVAGMFMLFRSDAYRAARGFDEAYFLYYEDVDLCRRLRAAGKSVVFDPRAEVVHDARRGSRRDARLSLRHMRSAARFLWG